MSDPAFFARDSLLSVAHRCQRPCRAFHQRQSSDEISYDQNRESKIQEYLVQS